jgi:EAL domain-containing protein (putative c-di-GMP-specific phosphodiesterase class I)
MYQAKASGGNAVRFYTRLMNDAVQRRVLIEAGLRQAIARRQLQLFIQPQVCIRRNEVVGGEVLLRWTDDSGRCVSPAEFVPVAEETGLINPIGNWVIEQTIALMSEWRRAGIVLPRLAINVSPRQLWLPGLAGFLLVRLAAAGIDPSLIEVEVTESIFVRSEDDSLDELRQLAAAGVQIALDDFGTGYSSLSYLRMLPFETLKIDRNFVMNIDQAQDRQGSAIVGAVGAMAGALGMKVVAEGVERASQLEKLHSLNCDVYQGYLFSPPVPAEQFASRFLGLPASAAGGAGAA